MISKRQKLLTLLFAGAFQVAAAQSGSSIYSWTNLPKVTEPVFRKDTFNIKQFGAKNDGVFLNTEVINNAINKCSKSGGGVVLIPQGLWKTGPIQLKSNVNLCIERAAILQFTADKSKYALIKGNFEGQKAIRNQSPISGDNLTNIAITGEGIIDGNGDAWRPVKKGKLTDADWQKLIASGGLLSSDKSTWYPSESYARGEQRRAGETEDGNRSVKDYENIKDYFRPALLVFNNCQKVLLSGTTFQNSPGWCLHTLLCEQLTFRGVRVRNEPYAQNGDGMDIESCSHVLVENCTLDCGDDGICIKSGKDEQGRKIGKASQYIVVRNNVVYYAHGGFVIGSEMSGGAHDIFVTDCSFIGTDNGLRFKTVRGRGGVVENIFIRNIAMRNIIHDAVLFDMYYFAKAPTLAQTNGKVEIPPVDEGTPQFRNFYITNLTCDGADRAMLIRGLPEMSIKNINLNHVTITANKGADIIEAKDVKLVDVQLNCPGNSPLINVENSQQITFDNIRSVNKPSTFFSISGDRSKQIIVHNTDGRLTASDALFSYGADKSALTINK